MQTVEETNQERSLYTMQMDAIAKQEAQEFAKKWGYGTIAALVRTSLKRMYNAKEHPYMEMVDLAKQINPKMRVEILREMYEAAVLANGGNR